MTATVLWGTLAVAWADTKNLYFNPAFENTNASHIERVAILPFANRLSVTAAQSEQLRKIFTEEINKYHLYDLVPNAKTQREIESMELTNSEAVLFSNAVKIGKLLGAEGVVVGTVSEYYNRIKGPPLVGVTIRFIDLRKEAILWSYLVQSKQDKNTGKRSAFSLLNSERFKVVFDHIVSADQNNSANGKHIAYGYNIKDLTITPSAYEFTIKCSLTSDKELLDVRDNDLAKNLEYYYFEKSRSKTWGYEVLDSFRANRDTPIILEDDEVKYGQHYYYRYYLTNKFGFSSYATVPQEVFLIPHPSPPTGLKTRSNGIRSILVDWNIHPDEGVEGYNIYREKASEDNYKKIKVIDSRKDNSFTDTGDGSYPLLDGRIYQYTISAYYGNPEEGRESEKSSYAQANTLGKPSPPTGLTAVSDKIRQVPLSFDVSPDENVSGYIIYAATSPGGSFETIQIINDRMKNQYIDERKNLGDNVTYYYKVASFYDNRLISELSEAVAATTQGSPLPPKKLKAESNLVQQVKLTWDASTNPQVTGYYIFRDDNNQANELTFIDGNNNTIYINKSLDCGKTYKYKIQSLNVVKVRGEFSDWVEAKTKHCPPKVATLDATQGDLKKITLNWKYETWPDLLQFNIFRKPADNNPSNTGDLIASVPASQLYYIDEQLGKSILNRSTGDGVAFLYYVQAEDKFEQKGPLSDLAQGDTKPLPTSLRNFSVRRTTDGILLTWDKGPEKDIQLYLITREEGFLRMSEKVFTTSGTEFIDKEVQPNQTYYYTIQVKDKTNLMSLESETISIETTE